MFNGNRVKGKGAGLYEKVVSSDIHPSVLGNILVSTICNNERIFHLSHQAWMVYG